METVAVYVGLDYHQSAVQVCVLDRQGRVLSNRSCANVWSTVVEWAEAHGRVVGAAIESCCGAADLAEELVQQAGWSVHLAHPGYVSRMRQNPDKHDWGDAHLLADLERIGYLPRVWLAPAKVRELRHLVNYRQQLAGQRRNAKLRVGALLRSERQIYRAGSAWTVRWKAWLQHTAEVSEEVRWVIDQQLEQLAWLHQQLRAVERRLAELTAEDSLVEKLLAQRGIGPITAWMMRAHIAQFERFRTGKQLSRFCGLTPRNASSGERQADAGLIRAGNPALRATLIEAAQRLIRLEGRWRDYGQQLRARGKPRNVAVTAVANRWIRWLFHQMLPAPAA